MRESEIFMYKDNVPTSISKNSKHSRLFRGLMAAFSADMRAEALQIIAEKIQEVFPEIKIWFARQLGKRRSYVAGAGEENFVSPDEFLLADNYYLFIQNKDKLSDKELRTIITLSRFLIIFFDSNKEE